MKPFTHYIAEINRRYDFVVRLAACDFNEDMKARISSALSMYVVENMGSGKRLPVQEHRDFAAMGPCEVHMLEVTLKYPTITPQIRQLIAEKLAISPKQVVVRTRLEEDQFDFVAEKPKTAADGSLLNNPDLDAETGQPMVGQSRIDSMLKELESRKYEFAGKPDAVKSTDMPMGTKSPVGSNKNTIPNPKGK